MEQGCAERHASDDNNNDDDTTQHHDAHIPQRPDPREAVGSCQSASRPASLFIASRFLSGEIGDAVTGADGYVTPSPAIDLGSKANKNTAGCDHPTRI